MVTRMIVCGGRKSVGREAQQFVYRTMDGLLRLHHKIVVIEGGQRTYPPDRKKGETVEPIGGIDYWAMRWARFRGQECITVAADWDRFGAQAGPIRNLKMIEEHAPGFVVAFPGGYGTSNMVGIARRRKIPIIFPK